MLDQAMDTVAQELVLWAVKDNPIFGTYIGIHDYDDLLPDSSMAALREEIRKLKDFRARIESLNPKELSPDRRIDRRCLIQAIDVNLFEEEVLESSQRFPSAAMGFGTSIMLLFNREFAPLPDRLSSISSRFSAAPKMLKDSRERLTKPVKIFTQIGIESCSSMQGMLGLVRTVAKDALPESEFDVLADASAQAADALKDHEMWLRESVLPVSADIIGIGARNLDRLLKIRELGYTTEEIYSMGKKYLSSAKKQLKSLAERIRPGATVEQAKEMVNSKHPKDFNEALQMTVKAMNEAKEFIVKNDIATIPPKEKLEVIETPEYLRHIMPIAAYMPSAYFDDVQHGIYMVTPVQKDSEELKKHCFAKNWVTAIHEGYPGHHLQSSCVATKKSYARSYVQAIENIEGWALYCEEMMLDRGFHSDPETKFSQTMDLIWRACRIVIDIDLHRRKITFDQAVQMLMKEAGLDKVSAASEVRRYTYTPGYPLSYLLGKHVITDLKLRAKKELGNRYSDKMFHDTFLYAGLMPMSLINEVFEQKFREMRSG